MDMSCHATGVMHFAMTRPVSVTSLSEVRKGDHGMSRADPYFLPLKRHSLAGQVSRSTVPWVRRVGEAMRVVADDAVDAVAGTWHRNAHKAPESIPHLLMRAAGCHSLPRAV